MKNGFLTAAVPGIILIAVLCTAPVLAAEQVIWIDPANGRDSNSGTSPDQALATISAGIDRIPKNSPLGTGYHIMLRPGNYPETSLPANGYIEGLAGTADNPVVIEAASGKHSAIIHGYLDLQKSSHISLVNLDLVTDAGKGGGGNVLHLASDDHILLKGCTLNGFDGTVRQPQETLKANQVRVLEVEDCDISGADWYSLDFVAVQGGYIRESRIHDAGEFALLIKGGSADLMVERNEIFKGRTGGISAGSGTGFDYLVSPYLHYDIYDTRFVNNIIHDNGIAVSINGGYNVLVAHNTLYRNANLLEVMHGRRGCEGDGTICERNRRAGGWGTTGPEGEYIPSANIFVYNNIMFNPSVSDTSYQQFTVQGPVTPPAGSNVPSPSVADRNLQIRGNVIRNGPQDLPLLNEGGGCAASNPSCNEQQIRSDNSINTVEIRLTAPDQGDYSPAGSSLTGIPCSPIPPFPNNDLPQSPRVPAGNPDNTVSGDRYGSARVGVCIPGAVLPGSSGLNPTVSTRTPVQTSGGQIQQTFSTPVKSTRAAPVPGSIAIIGVILGGLVLFRVTEPQK